MDASKRVGSQPYHHLNVEVSPKVRSFEAGAVEAPLGRGATRTLRPENFERRRLAHRRLLWPEAGFHRKD